MCNVEVKNGEAFPLYNATSRLKPCHSIQAIHTAQCSLVEDIRHYYPWLTMRILIQHPHLCNDFYIHDNATF